MKQFIAITFIALSFAIFQCLGLPTALSAEDAKPYAGMETRQIKSLSNADIDELRRGGGWGLALPAELNGLPGPAHILELREEIELTDEQATQVEAIYQQMLSDAIRAGEEFIAAEAELSQAFEKGPLSNERLETLIENSSKAKSRLRFVHLSRHLMTSDILTEGQITAYNVLRGYSNDACANVPNGHDPAMWRQHNGCN